MTATSGVEPAAGLAQQGVALAQDPVDLGAQRVVLGCGGHQGVVEVAPPLGRAALDQRRGRRARTP